MTDPEATAALNVPVPLPELRLGRVVVGTPVVLAPMAGITNRAFRRLCRRETDPALPSCLYVSEMVTSRALLERNPATMRLIEHDPEEYPRSVQLYGVDPDTVAAAVRLLLSEDRADHIDLNFGCPVPKVTRKGGGAALPWKRELFRRIVGRAVAEASRHDVPVTIKMRMGIDPDHLTYLEAGLAAEAEGVAAVALHARTAEQRYAGHAEWSAIARLKQAVRTVPVLGNGDIWSADDAMAMLAGTGCDGIVVGRGCLGRPWLFGDLAAAFGGRPGPARPDLGEVGATMRRHARYLVEFFGQESRGCRDFRKHVAWYLKGFPVGADLRCRMALVEDLAGLDALVAQLDAGQSWPGEPADGPRGRSGAPRAVALPDGWLASPELSHAEAGMLGHAELAVSGG
ncbi:MAG TPA: tRNA dihydrouridine synthase DusB [Dermatophilaceae bacterium]|nr:tRNA dihydrouridine synthase DusB [Dermatophilaceae bacterium]